MKKFSWRRQSSMAASEILKYVFLGCIIYVASLVLMSAVSASWAVSDPVAYGIVQIIILSTSFPIVRFWVFKARSGRVASQAGRFLISSAFFRFAHFSIYSAFWSVLHAPREIGVLLTIASVFPIKYLTDRNLVFSVKSVD